MRTTTLPNLSSDFTIADIRKLRDFNSERFADMTHQEIIDDINNGALEFLVLVDNARPNQQTGT